MKHRERMIKKATDAHDAAKQRIKLAKDLLEAIRESFHGLRLKGGITLQASRIEDVMVCIQAVQGGKSIDEHSFTLEVTKDCRFMLQGKLFAEIKHVLDSLENRYVPYIDGEYYADKG